MKKAEPEGSAITLSVGMGRQSQPPPPSLPPQLPPSPNDQPFPPELPPSPNIHQPESEDPDPDEPVRPPETNDLMPAASSQPMPKAAANAVSVSPGENPAGKKKYVAAAAMTPPRIGATVPKTRNATTEITTAKTVCDMCVPFSSYELFIYSPCAWRASGNRTAWRSSANHRTRNRFFRQTPTRARAHPMRKFMKKRNPEVPFPLLRRPAEQF